MLAAFDRNAQVIGLKRHEAFDNIDHRHTRRPIQAGLCSLDAQLFRFQHLRVEEQLHGFMRDFEIRTEFFIALHTHRPSYLDISVSGCDDGIISM